MTPEFDRGFADGELEAWRRRLDPLPMKPPIVTEYQRGYWAARLPRGESWHRGIHRTQRWSVPA